MASGERVGHRRCLPRVKDIRRGQEHPDRLTPAQRRAAADAGLNVNVLASGVNAAGANGNFGTTMGNHVEAFAKTVGYELVQRVPYSLLGARSVLAVSPFIEARSLPSPSSSFHI